MQTPITTDTLAFLCNTQAAGAGDDRLPELSRAAWEYSYKAIKRDATAEYDEDFRSEMEEDDYIAFLAHMCRDEITFMVEKPSFWPQNHPDTRLLTRKRHRILAAIFEYRAFPYGVPNLFGDTSAYKTY